MVKLFPKAARTEFLDLVCAGMPVRTAARRVGAVHATGHNWWVQSGLMMTVNRGATGGLADPAPSVGGPGRALGLEERGMIQMGVRMGLSYAKIGALIGRDKSVVWREVKRHTSADGKYYASVAHAKAHQDRRRPKPFRLAKDEGLCRLIGVWMDDGWSPKLISSMLAYYFGDDQTMQVSHETIYQALYVQTRGNLRADLAEKLSLKRKQRIPHGTDRRANSPYKEAFKISQRPAEVQDRAVPGHWEGDLIIGANGTAIGTLVERSTRFTILLHLPGDHTAETVAAAMIREMASSRITCAGRSPGTAAPNWPTTQKSRPLSIRRCTSATRTRPGSAAPTKTPTGSCGSGSRKALTFQCTPPRTSAWSQRNSTAAPDQH